jgi:hypothetical protein
VQKALNINAVLPVKLPPAFIALLIQGCALLLVWIFVKLILLCWAINLSPLSFVVLQAVSAVTLTYFVSMASWWRWIQLGFPLALYGMSQFHVPSDLYLIGFLFTLSLYWTTFRTQVPFFPSRPIVWQKVAEIIPLEKPIQFIEIGSGLGDLSMYLANLRPDTKICGVEVAPLPWLISKFRAYLRKSKVIFKLGNYHQYNFNEYDVVFAYLSPVAMGALWQKASKEMRKGSLLISYEFDIFGISPSEIIPAAENGPKIYIWKM